MGKILSTSHVHLFLVSWFLAHQSVSLVPVYTAHTRWVRSPHLLSVLLLQVLAHLFGIGSSILMPSAYLVCGVGVCLGVSSVKTWIYRYSHPYKTSLWKRCGFTPWPQLTLMRTNISPEDWTGHRSGQALPCYLMESLKVSASKNGLLQGWSFNKGRDNI